MGLTDGFLSMVGRQSRKPSGWLGKVMFGHLAARGHKPLTRWATGFMDIQPTDRVLDIGCGGGMAIQLIADIAVEGFVAGVDYSEDMVQHACKRNANTIRAGRVEIKHGDVSALPYDDESFDKVIAVETFYFWPDPVPNLQEVRRVMRSPESFDKTGTSSAQGEPGRLVALAMEVSKEMPNWQKHMAQKTAQMGFPIYSAAEMVEMLTEAGFGQAWFETVPDEGWGWLCALGIK